MQDKLFMKLNEKQRILEMSRRQSALIGGEEIHKVIRNSADLVNKSCFFKFFP